MTALHVVVIVIWALFWLYWIGSAFGANPSHGGLSARGLPARAACGLAIIAFLKIADALGLRAGQLAVHSPVVEALGIVLLLSGLGFAVWARVHLGRNWGLPMTQRAEPELITSGPYHLIRHPIYSGLILAALGTALAINLIAVPLPALILPYFVRSAHIEERNLTAAFPQAYTAYRARSRMLIPFLF